MQGRPGFAEPDRQPVDSPGAPAGRGGAEGYHPNKQPQKDTPSTPGSATRGSARAFRRSVNPLGNADRACEDPAFCGAAEAWEARGAFADPRAFHRTKDQFQRAMMGDTSLSLGAKVAGIALLLSANTRTGRTWKSLATLCKETGMPRTSLQRALAELLARRWFVRLVRAGSGTPRRQATTIYMPNIVTADTPPPEAVWNDTEPSPPSTTLPARGQGDEPEKPTGTEPETQKFSTTLPTGGQTTLPTGGHDPAHGRAPTTREITRIRSSDSNARERARDAGDNRTEPNREQRPLPLMAMVAEARHRTADASSAFREGAESTAWARAEHDAPEPEEPSQGCGYVWHEGYQEDPPPLVSIGELARQALERARRRARRWGGQ